MAATLNSEQEELTFFSFPIEKQEDTATINPVDGTPDVLIWGKATDGTIDGDREIVDPDWSAKAIQEWASSKANVRMSHDPKRPVGKGQEVHVTTDGHYVKSLIADPLAKHFIRLGVLNDYSVGISMPDFRYRDPKLDPHGKASRIITGRPDGQSRIAEISICDRGSNFNSSFQIVKSAGGFTGTMVGDEDEIAKAAPSGLLTKMAHDGDDMVNVDLPKGASISISPADFAKLRTFKQELVTKTAAVADKRDVSTAERRTLAGEHNALPDGSYPIDNTGDLHNAAVLARSGHGDVAAARRLIARRAGELGVANPLDESDGANKSASGDAAILNEDAQTVIAEDALKEAEPEVTKDPEPDAEPKPVKKAKKKPKGPKKMPPWLNKPDDDKDDDSSCKGAHAWVHVGGDSPVPDIRCEKCKTTPAEAAGLSGTHDMTAAPVPEFLESPPMASTKSGPTPASASGAEGHSMGWDRNTGERGREVALSMTPVPAHREPDGALNDPMEADMNASDGDHETPTRLEAGMMKSSPEVAAILRFKHAGIDTELGRIHDLTCPAYHPEDVAKCHPFAALHRIDADAFQKEAVKAACGPDLERAMSLQKAWQAAGVLKGCDESVLNDYRLAAHKAFRDANPGPTSAPTPGMIAPGKYNRPLITDGHEASSAGHDGPNSSPAVATSAPNAHSFDRPPLAAGHQSPSPSHMKGGNGEYPSMQGVPTQLNYAQMEKDRGRMALVEMHDHLGRQFPEVCPMDRPGSRPLRGVQPENHPVPATAGIGKGGVVQQSGSGDSVPVMLDNGYVLPKGAIPVVAASFKADLEELGTFADAEVYKGFKKMRKKLGKKVLAGTMTVDEARARMGRQFAQKGAEPAATIPATYVTPGDPNLTPTQIKELQDSLQKAAGENAGRIIVLPPGSRIAGPAGDTSPIHSVPATPAPDAIKAAAPVARPLPPSQSERVVAPRGSVVLDQYGNLIPPRHETAAAALDPEVIKAAVGEATTELKDLLVKQQETFTTKLAEQQRVIDAIADQPDPSTASFSGLAFNPARTARPAGVAEKADHAERVQQMTIRSLQELYNSSSDPYEREGYYKTIAKMRGASQ